MALIFKHNRKCHARPVRASGIASPRPPHKAGVTSIAGNILIYILGAIFLMGLLVVAMKGSFQEGSGIDPEKTALLVGQVQRYGAELERGVAYVLRNGYSETDIRFAHPNAASAYGLITDIPARQVFSPEGGGVEWRAPPIGSQPASTAWLFSGRNNAMGVGTNCTAGGQTNCTDLIAMLPNVTKAFCLQLNNNVGVTNPSGEPPAEATGLEISTLFNGIFYYNSNIDTVGATPTQYKTEGCFSYLSQYYYYRVLLAR